MPTTDFPEHLKLLQQLESLWGESRENEGSERQAEEETERERSSRERQLSMHSEAGKLEINTTFCVLAGGRVHISRCMCECLTGDGGRWWGETEGEAKWGRGSVGTALQRVAEPWVSMQLAQASTPVPVGCLLCVSLCPWAYTSLCPGL